MKLGNINLTDLKLGTTQVSKVMLGTQLVWEKAVEDELYLYIVEPTRLSKYLKADKSLIGFITISNATTITSDENHIYLGGDSSFGIKKYMKSDLSFVTQNMSISFISTQSIMIDNNLIYVVSTVTSASMYPFFRLSTSDLSFVDGIQEASSNYFVVIDDTYIYRSSGALLARVIEKRLKSDLTLITSSSAMSTSVTRAVSIGENIFVVFGSTLRKYLKSDMSQIGSDVTVSYSTNGIVKKNSSIYLFNAKVSEFDTDLNIIRESPLFNGSINNIIIDNTHVYAGSKNNVTPAHLGYATIYNLTDLSIEYDYSFLVGGGNDIKVDETHVYVVSGNFVRKYLKSNLSYVSQTESYGGVIYSIAIDDTHIYVGGATTLTVRKYLKSDMSYVGQTASYNGIINSITIDATHIYVGGFTTNTVRKYLKSNLSYVSQTVSYGGGILKVEIDDTHIYVGGQVTLRVRKYLKSDMSYISQTESHTTPINTLSIDDTHIYTGTQLQYVRKYLKSDMSYVALTPIYGGTIHSIVIDDTYIYACGDTTNRVRKYLKSNLSYVSQGTDYGYTLIRLVLDNNDLYIYPISASTSSLKKALKTDLSDTFNLSRFAINNLV